MDQPNLTFPNIFVHSRINNAKNHGLDFPRREWIMTYSLYSRPFILGNLKPAGKLKNSTMNAYHTPPSSKLTNCKHFAPLSSLSDAAAGLGANF